MDKSWIEEREAEYCDGSRERLLDQVDEWASSGAVARRVMSVIEPLGSGKTVAMAKVCKIGRYGLDEEEEGGEQPQRLWWHLKSLVFQPVQRKKQFRVGAAHFFSSQTDSSVRTCFLSISKQLCTRIPGLETNLESYSSNLDELTDLKTLFRACIAKPLEQVEKPSSCSSILVVLDGLNEVSVQEREELLEIISNVWERETPSWLLLLVAGRPESNVQRSLLQSLAATKEVNLQGYIQENLESVIQSSSDLDNAVQIVRQQSEEVFLYARHLVSMLQSEATSCRMSLNDLNRFCCNRFPPGLRKLYRESFGRFLDECLDGDRHVFEVMLSALAVARAPVHHSTIMILLQDLLSPKEVDALLSKCGQLLVSENETLRFVHSSMAKFLLDRTQSGRALSVSFKRGHQRLAQALSVESRSPYSLHHLLYHLGYAGYWNRVQEEYLFNYDWVLALVSEPGAARRVVEDFGTWLGKVDADCAAVIHALELGLNTLETYPHLLPFTLLGRFDDRSHPLLQSFDSLGLGQDAFFLPTTQALRPVPRSLQMVLRGHEKRVSSVAVTDRWMLSGCDNLQVKLWDRESGECIFTLLGHRDKIVAVHLLEDVAVSCSKDGQVRLWECCTGKCLQVIESHPLANSVAVAVEDVVVTTDAEASGCVVCLRDLVSGQVLLSLEGHSKQVLAVDKEGDIVVSGSADHTARVWDVVSRSEVAVLEHISSVVQVSVSRHRVATATKQERIVRVWNMFTGQCLLSLSGHSYEIWGIKLSEDLIVSGAHDRTVRVWDCKSGDCLQVLQDEQFRSPSCLALEGSTVLTGTKDGSVRLWEGGFDSKSSTAWSCAAPQGIAMDEDVLVVGSAENIIRVIDRSSGACVHEWKGPASHLRHIAVNNGTVVCGSPDGVVKMWNYKTGRCEGMFEQLPSMLHAVDISDKWVALGLADRVILIDRVTEKQTALRSARSDTQWFLTDVAIDGDTLLAGLFDGRINVWNAASGRIARVLEGHSSGVSTVAVDAASDVAASGGMDETVRVWELSSGQCLFKLVDFGQHVAVSNSLLVSATKSGVVRVWNWSLSPELGEEMEPQIEAKNVVAVLGSRVGALSLCQNTIAITDCSKTPHLLQSCTPHV